MDWQTVFNLIGTGVMGLIGYFVKDVRDELRAAHAANAATKQTISDFRVKVAEDYVTHNDLGDIKATLVRIEQKLDGKADK